MAVLSFSSWFAITRLSVTRELGVADITALRLSGGALVRVAIGDAAGAQVLAERLHPFEGQLSTVGTGPSFGDVHWALSAVAAMAGDLDDAVRHADASVDVLTRAGAGPFLARVLLHRASLRPETAVEDRRQAAALVERFDLRLLRRQMAAAG